MYTLFMKTKPWKSIGLNDQINNSTVHLLHSTLHNLFFIENSCSLASLSYPLPCSLIILLFSFLTPCIPTHFKIATDPSWFYEVTHLAWVYV